MNDVTGNNSVVLSLKKETLDRLKPCLSLVIEETADYLLTLSTSARLDPANQNQCYDTFLNLQAETKRVVADICGNVESAFGAIGTSQLSFLVSDSLQLRESNTCQRLTRALRSIGCHIILDDYSPERVSDRSTELLNVSEIVIDTTFWERAAQSEPWRSLLPQLIADTHHILGQAVSVRDPSITENIEHTGIDFIERESDVLLSTSELLRSLSSEFS